MERTLMKMLVEVAGAASSAVIGVVAAAGESQPLTYGAIVAVLGFAGLLVRQVVAGQREIWKIVAAKDKEIAERDDVMHYLRWELEAMRYRHGEREHDPGPYVQRSRVTDKEVPGDR